MALSYKVGNFAKTTAGAPTSQTVTGVGFQPKAVIFFETGRPTTGYDIHDTLLIGLDDGANRRGCAFTSEDAVTASDTYRRRSETYPIMHLNPLTGALLATGYISSFNSDGFVVQWDTNDTTGSIIHYIAIGGADLTNVKAGTITLGIGTGTEDFTAVGFQPDFVMFLQTFTEALNTTVPNAELGIGFAKSATERAAITINSEDNRGTMDTWRIQRTDRCIEILDPTTGAIDAQVDFDSFLSNGFRLNKIDAPAAATPVFYLALKGGSYKVGSFNQPSATGNQTISGVGFTPVGLILASYNQTSQTTVQTDNKFSFGGANSPTSRGCIWGHDLDAAADADANSATKTAFVINLSTGPSTVNAEADFVSFGSGQFTINWVVADATAREIIYVCIGDSPPPAVGGILAQVI